MINVGIKNSALKSQDPKDNIKILDKHIIETDKGISPITRR